MSRATSSANPVPRSDQKEFLSKARCRTIRRAAKLVDEMDYHSFKAYGIVWTRRHGMGSSGQQHQQQTTSGSADATRSRERTEQLSRRRRRSNDRARIFYEHLERAKNHHLRGCFRR